KAASAIVCSLPKRRPPLLFTTIRFAGVYVPWYIGTNDDRGRTRANRCASGKKAAQGPESACGVERPFTGRPAGRHRPSRYRMQDAVFPADAPGDRSIPQGLRAHAQGLRQSQNEGAFEMKHTCLLLALAGLATSWTTACAQSPAVAPVHVSNSFAFTIHAPL